MDSYIILNLVLAIIVIVTEILIFLRIRHHFSFIKSLPIASEEEMNSPIDEDFTISNEVLEITEDKPVKPSELLYILDKVDIDSIKIPWIKNLQWMIGRKSNLTEVRKVLEDALSKGIKSINLYCNLAPAISLIFTFLGMTITLFLLFVVDTPESNEYDINKIINAIMGLFPVFLGGFLGIIVYSYGAYKQKVYLVKLNKLFDQYINVFVKVEPFESPINAKNIEDAFEKLLKPVKNLFNKLNTVNKSFTTFTNNFEDNNIKFNEFFEGIQTNNKDFLTGVHTEVQNFKDYIATLISSLHKEIEPIFDMTSKIESYETSLDESIKQWGKFYQDGQEIIKSFKKVKDVIVSLLSASGNLDINTKALNEQHKRTIKLFEDTTTLINDFELGLKSLRDINAGFDKFVEKFPPESIISISLSLERMKSLIEKLPENIKDEDLNKEQRKAFKELTNISSEVKALNGNITSKLSSAISENFKEVSKNLQDLIGQIKKLPENLKDKDLKENQTKVIEGLTNISSAIETLNSDFTLQVGSTIPGKFDEVSNHLRGIIGQVQKIHEEVNENGSQNYYNKTIQEISKISKTLSFFYQEFESQVPIMQSSIKNIESNISSKQKDRSAKRNKSKKSIEDTTDKNIEAHDNHHDIIYEIPDNENNKEINKVSEKKVPIIPDNKVDTPKNETDTLKETKTNLPGFWGFLKEIFKTSSK